MQLYKGLQKIIPKRIQHCIQQMCTSFFKYICKSEKSYFENKEKSQSKKLIHTGMCSW